MINAVFSTATQGKSDPFAMIVLKQFAATVKERVNKTQEK